MNKFIMTLAILMLAAITLMAQEYPPPYEYSATSAPSTTTSFNFDIVDSAYIDTTAIHELIYRDQSETVWNHAIITQLYQACTTYTYSGNINYQPPSDLLEWYYRSEIDTVVVSQSPKNASDLFPAPAHLMADLGDDAVGDVANGGGSNLDITHLDASYSDSKLYFRLENDGGGFPTSGGIFVSYIYSVGILNPNATDSMLYVLIYADVPMLFSPGLYTMHSVDSSFTQIGSISTDISGNSLSMSCDIADLVAQPGWSTWPPESGFIGVAPVTATANFTDLTSNDFGKSALFIPGSHQLDFAAINTSPILTDPLISFDDYGQVAAEITYTDAENNLPVLKGLNFDGVQHDLTACEKEYQTGAVFSTSLTVTESGWFSYYFEFSDGIELATTAIDSVYIEVATYVCGDANNDGIANVGDAVFLINYVFKGGPAPDPIEAGDANCDGSTDVGDAVYLINFVFKEGPAPCASCP